MTSFGQRLAVIKIGGSLFDLPDLRARLHVFFRELATCEVVLVPGGGSTADLVRGWDEKFGLGEERAHWLALRAMSLNAHFLAAVLGNGQVIRHADERHAVIQAGRLPILDGYAWAEADEDSPEHLPHCWEVTSDSVAARVALTSGAAELLLLKSMDWEGSNWKKAAAAGVVDRYFPCLCATGDGLRIRVRNLRNF